MREKLEIPCGNDESIDVPARWVVCPRCDGRGQHSNPAIDGHGIGAEEWNGPDWDDESREAYRRGLWDVSCCRCGGRTTVLEVDRERCTPEQLKAVEAHELDQAEAAAERASEARYDY